MEIINNYNYGNPEKDKSGDQDKETEKYIAEVHRLNNVPDIVNENDSIQINQRLEKESKLYYQMQNKNQPI